MDMLFNNFTNDGEFRKKCTLSLAEHLGISIMLERFQSAERRPDAIDRLKTEAIDRVIY